MALAPHSSCSLTLEWASRRRDGLPLPLSGEEGSRHQTKPVLPGLTVAPEVPGWTPHTLPGPTTGAGRAWALSRLLGRWACLST